MLNWIIDFSLRHRFVVVVGVSVCALLGVLALMRIDIDAFPDTTPVQVQINTVAPALPPNEMEQQITMPIERKIAGLPHLKRIRSVSKFGLSQVVATFSEDTDIYFARQVLNERLNTLVMPAGVARPTLGPVATGLGEIFHYVVTSKGYDFSLLPEEERIQKLTELRTLHDWTIRPQLLTVEGVTEVNSWGGYEKQYQVRIDPDRLIKHGLTFHEVIGAITENNRNVGGGTIRQNSQGLLVHGIGRTENIKQIESVVVTARDGIPIYIRDVADVRIGHEIRRGSVTANGKGEAVLGLGFMLMGQNSRTITRKLKSKLEEIKETLPSQVEVKALYDRTELVNHVINTASTNLFEGGLLVIAVLFLFLGNLRAALIVALAIPLSMLFAFSGMLRFGIAASLLSLGAIDFGMVVDSSVVMVENCVRQLGQAGADQRSRLEIIRDAAIEVRKPTLFGELIIIIVYLPILTLEGVEGKLFRPMALTVIFALAGSMVLSLTLMPVLASLLLKHSSPSPVRNASFSEESKDIHPEADPVIMRLLKRLYAPLLGWTMQFWPTVLIFAAGMVAIAVTIVMKLGSEFVPKLSEGAIAIGVVRLAGTDLEESNRLNTLMEKAILRAFPEVEHTWSRVGTAEIATDPMGVELTDLFITLKPRNQWAKARAERTDRLRQAAEPDLFLIEELDRRTASTQAELTELLQKELREIPGQRIAFSQPIEMRMNEMDSGVRSDLAVKLCGDDLKVLKEKAVIVKRLLESIPGNADVNVEQITDQPVLKIEVRRDELARYKVPAQTVLDLVESLGGKHVGEVIEGNPRFPIVVRLPENLRTSPEAIGSIVVATPSGERLPLARLAEIYLVDVPSTITREGGQRRAVVTCNVRGRDRGSFVAEAREIIHGTALGLPEGYRVEWDGSFEHYENALNRLIFVILPLVVVLVFGLLFLTYGNIVDALRVCTSVPLGCVGGIIALWLRDMPFSIPAAIGFIAMSGVALLDDMILVSYIRQLRKRGSAVHDAVRQAAMTRLRPILMTTLVACLGFLPMALSTGMGAEVQRPLATVVIGGVLSAMLMSLLVIRVMYVFFDKIAHSLQRAIMRTFGWQADQLKWLFGDYRDDKAAVVPAELWNGSAISSGQFQENLNT